MKACLSLSDIYCFKNIFLHPFRFMASDLSAIVPQSSVYMTVEFNPTRMETDDTFCLSFNILTCLGAFST